MGFSKDEAKAVVDILKAEQIEYYSSKTSNKRARAYAVYDGYDSDIGKTPETEFTWYVYVHKNDYKDAMHALETNG